MGSDGSLVYLPTDRLADEQWSMMWVDRSGEAQAIPAPNHRYFMPRISPDGTRIAIDVRDPAGSDIWIWHFDRQVLTRFFPHRHHR